jgi:hypothetical protein
MRKKMIEYFIGIDIGFNGGICVLKDMQIIETLKMPIFKSDKTKYDKETILKFINKYNYNNNCFIVVEDLQPRPFGVKQMFMLGYGLGVFETLVEGLKIPHTFVKPKTWQKEIFKDINTGDTKLNAFTFCKRVFPNYDFNFGSKNFHDGICDSVCLSIYGAKFNMVSKNENI